MLRTLAALLAVALLPAAPSRAGYDGVVLTFHIGNSLTDLF